VRFPLRHSLRSRHLSRKRARKENLLLARLRERWVVAKLRDGEGNFHTAILSINRVVPIQAAASNRSGSSRDFGSANVIALRAAT
jgi:hypothetical protein